MLHFFSQAFLSSVGHISPLKVRQTAEYPAQLHLALLLSPLHCDMIAAHCRNIKRSLGKIHMDSIHCLKFKKILKQTLAWKSTYRTVWLWYNLGEVNRNFSI